MIVSAEFIQDFTPGQEALIEQIREHGFEPQVSTFPNSKRFICYLEFAAPHLDRDAPPDSVEAETVTDALQLALKGVGTDP